MHRTRKRGADRGPRKYVMSKTSCMIEMTSPSIARKRESTDTDIPYRAQSRIQKKTFSTLDKIQLPFKNPPIFVKGLGIVRFGKLGGGHGDLGADEMKGETEMTAC